MRIGEEEIYYEYLRIINIFIMTLYDIVIYIEYKGT